MADWKSSLNKIAEQLHTEQSSFDDDPTAAPVVEIDDSKKEPSINERVWQYVKDHPVSTLNEVRDGMPEFNRQNISTRLASLFSRGALERKHVTVGGKPQFAYVAVGDTYPYTPLDERIRRMQAARAQSATEGKKRKPRKSAIARKPGRPPKKQPVATTVLVQTPVQPKGQPATMTARELINTLPIGVAAELYQELKRMFNT